MAVSLGDGGGDLFAPRLQLSAQLAQPLLTLSGQLLQLHQLLLDVVQIAGQIAPQLAHRFPAGGERIHDALLHPDHLAQLGGASGISTGGLRLEQRHIVLHPLDVSLGHAAAQAGGQAQPEQGAESQ